MRERERASESERGGETKKIEKARGRWRERKRQMKKDSERENQIAAERESERRVRA